MVQQRQAFPGGWLSDKESAANAGDVKDTGSILEWGKYPGGGHGNPLQYSFLENPIDRGAWHATVHSVPKSLTQLTFRKFRRHGFDPWVRKIWRRRWQPTPVFLTWKSHGQRSLVGYSHKESDKT